MPVYEFKCNGCGELGDVIAPIEEMVKAPTCHVCKKEMNRVYQIGGVVLRGKGFYKTDNPGG